MYKEYQYDRFPEVRVGRCPLFDSLCHSGIGYRFDPCTNIVGRDMRKNQRDFPAPHTITIEESLKLYQKFPAYEKRMPRSDQPRRLVEIGERIFEIYALIESFLHLPIQKMPEDVARLAKRYGKLQWLEAEYRERWLQCNTHAKRHKLAVSLALQYGGASEIPAPVMAEYPEIFDVD